jgi:hypothetical protein
MNVVADRDYEERLANDLFQLEQGFVEAFQRFGACGVVRQIGESTLACVKQAVRGEELMAESAKLRGDDYHYGIAWERVMHGSTICRAVESSLARWFS